MQIDLGKNELIHFVGIGGIGMSGLALIMSGLGYKVQGSDIADNKNIERLIENKIRVFLNHKKENIKKTTVLELHMIGSGLANINCTLSNEPFDFEVNSKMKLLLKFGDKYDDSNDELIILPHGSHTVELDQFLYEMIVLSMPIRNVHPGIDDGSLKSDNLNRLKDFDINKEKSSNFDPRWDKLKKLKK